VVYSCGGSIVWTYRVTCDLCSLCPPLDVHLLLTDHLTIRFANFRLSFTPFIVLRTRRRGYLLFDSRLLATETGAICIGGKKSETSRGRVKTEPLFSKCYPYTNTLPLSPPALLSLTYALIFICFFFFLFFFLHSGIATSYQYCCCLFSLLIMKLPTTFISFKLYLL